MSSLSVFFLGVIAFCALVQALFFAGAAFGLLKAAARLDELVTRAEEEWPKIGRKLTDVTAQIADASNRAEAAAARAERVVDKVASATERASHLARTAARLPLAPIRTGAALWQALRRAVSVYQRPRGEAAR